MKRILTPHLADKTPRSFSPKTAQDLLVDADALHECPAATIDTETAEEALSILFREANIGEVGWAAAYREKKNRSLSVGDVVSVRAADAPDTEDSTYFICAPLGWLPVEWDDIYDLLTAITWHDGYEARREAEEAQHRAARLADLAAKEASA